ncbi:esterase/lipase family protein [Rhodococcus marinonascens]|uniref:esterase/lipase family protein n=1 Tax=Rhodococcus marinonascens TaxID=38311 RepID=UPI000934C8B0|nr:alpha/beta fold hydrolase [Rhodococcus marinonascens]
MRWKKSGRLSAVVAAVATVALSVGGAQASADPAPLPVSYSSLPALGTAVVNPDSDPPGANDWSCRPTEAHPRPVVLTHGTLANMTINWATLSPLLTNNGYCVFALNFGQEFDANYVGLPGASKAGATGSMEGSASQLADFVERVKSATGAPKVDIVGHSQGGSMPRYYLKNLGGATSVDKLIALAPSNHPGSSEALGQIPGANEAFGTAGFEQSERSDFLNQLNAGGETMPGVSYTVIATRYDEIVAPYTLAFLTGPNVVNILLQDECPQNLSDHLSLAFDRLALSHVLNALDPSYPVAACEFSPPVIGG